MYVNCRFLNGLWSPILNYTFQSNYSLSFKILDDPIVEHELKLLWFEEFVHMCESED